MFFLLPMQIIVLIYIFAAILPAFYLMRYIYRMDNWEPEPLDLLIKLAGLGVAAVFISILLESIIQLVLDMLPIPGNTIIHTILTAFIGVAMVEEGAKYFLLYRRTWKDPNFDCRFDGIVYSAFVSLGFAAFENLKYVFGYGLSVALPRAVLAVPGHMAFAVVFGTFYSRARHKENMGLHDQSKANLIVGYMAAVFLHGFYDACAMIGSSGSTLIFIIFVTFMYVFIIRLLKKEKAEDRPL